MKKPMTPVTASGPQANPGTASLPHGNPGTASLPHGNPGAASLPHGNPGAASLQHGNPVTGGRQHGSPPNGVGLAASAPGRHSAFFRLLATRVLPSLRATPLTTAVVLLLVAATLTLRLVLPGDIDTIVAWASTNVQNLASHPVAALLASAFVVPSGLLPELLLVALGFTLLERSIGTLRTAAVALSGHVLATLLTEYGAYVLTDSARDRPDVGVSYAMFAVLAAGACRLTGKLRVAALLAVAAAVLIPLAVAPGMTTTGHLLSALIGPLTMVALRRR